MKKQRWFRATKMNEDKYLELMHYCRDGYKTDWKIERRVDTLKPYVLGKMCTNQRYGVFDKLSSAKQVAYLLDFG